MFTCSILTSIYGAAKKKKWSSFYLTCRVGPAPAQDARCTAVMSSKQYTVVVPRRHPLSFVGGKKQFPSFSWLYFKRLKKGRITFLNAKHGSWFVCLFKFVEKHEFADISAGRYAAGQVSLQRGQGSL